MFSWGSGSHGQLSLGDLEDRDTPNVVIAKCGASKVTGGGSHSLMISTEGKVYACGNGEDGQTSLNELMVTTFTLIEELKDETISHIAAGWNHSVVLTSQGELYIWGNNKFGQLGNQIDKVSFKPQQLPMLKVNIKTIACGLRHTIAIDADGIGYSWGDNNYQQCGTLKKHKTIPNPIRIESIPPIKEVSCGAKHSIVTTADGECYSFGSNRFGQCGKIPNTQLQLPTKIELSQPIIKTTCGWSHTLALTASNTLIVFGRNDFGQLGLSHQEKVDIPIPNTFFNEKPIHEIVSGSEHSLALTQNGEVYAWGWGSHGQLGLGNEEDQCIPQVIQGLCHIKPGQIGCGYGCSFAM